MLKRVLSTVQANLSPHLKLFHTALVAIHQDTTCYPEHSPMDVGQKAHRIYERLKGPKEHLLFEFIYQVILAYNTASQILDRKEMGRV